MSNLIQSSIQSRPNKPLRFRNGPVSRKPLPSLPEQNPDNPPMLSLLDAIRLSNQPGQSPNNPSSGFSTSPLPPTQDGQRTN